MDFIGPVTAIAGVLGALAGALGAYPAIAKYQEEKRARLREKIDEQLESERQEQPADLMPAQIVWATTASEQSFQYRKSKAVISIANFKGGVGKTTISAALAAYIGSVKGKKTLVIDFDYQGSLSLMFMRMLGRRDRTSTSTKLISRDAQSSTVRELATSLSGPAGSNACVSNCDLFTAFYPLDTHETTEMVNWSRDGGNDVRYRLRHLLDSRDFDEYDVVIIDCPPRFSTGTINALCASTHLIIPSIMDILSAEAVVYFCKQIEQLKSRIFPNLQLLGILPNMVYRAERFTQREDQIAERIDGEVRRILGGDQWVMREAALARSSVMGGDAGDAAPSVFSAAAIAAFARTGLAISKRLW